MPTMTYTIQNGILTVTDVGSGVVTTHQVGGGQISSKTPSQISREAELRSSGVSITPEIEDKIALELQEEARQKIAQDKKTMPIQSSSAIVTEPKQTISIIKETTLDRPKEMQFKREDESVFTAKPTRIDIREKGSWYWETPFGEVRSTPQHLEKEIERKAHVSAIYKSYEKAYPGWKAKKTGIKEVDYFQSKHPELSPGEVELIYQKVLDPKFQATYWAMPVITGQTGLDVVLMTPQSIISGKPMSQIVSESRQHHLQQQMDIQHAIYKGKAGEVFEKIAVPTAIQGALVVGTLVAGKLASGIASKTAGAKGLVGKIGPYVPFAVQTGIASYYLKESAGKLIEATPKFMRGDVVARQQVAGATMGMAYSVVGIKRAWKLLPIKEVPIGKKATVSSAKLKAKVFETDENAGIIKVRGKIEGLIGKKNPRVFKGDVSLSYDYKKGSGEFAKHIEQETGTHSEYRISQGIISKGVGFVDIETPKMYKLHGTDIIWTSSKDKLYFSTPIYSESFGITPKRITDMFAETSFLGSGTEIIAGKIRQHPQTVGETSTTGKVKPIAITQEGKPKTVIFESTGSKVSVSRKYRFVSGGKDSAFYTEIEPGSMYLTKSQKIAGVINIDYAKAKIIPSSTSKTQFAWDITKSPATKTKAQTPPSWLTDIATAVKKEGTTIYPTTRIDVRPFPTEALSGTASLLSSIKLTSLTTVPKPSRVAYTLLLMPIVSSDLKRTDNILKSAKGIDVMLIEKPVKPTAKPKEIIIDKIADVGKPSPMITYASSKTAEIEAHSPPVIEITEKQTSKGKIINIIEPQGKKVSKIYPEKRVGFSSLIETTEKQKLREKIKKALSKQEIRELEKFSMKEALPKVKQKLKDREREKYKYPKVIGLGKDKKSSKQNIGDDVSNIVLGSQKIIQTERLKQKQTNKLVSIEKMTTPGLRVANINPSVEKVTNIPIDFKIIGIPEKRKTTKPRSRTKGFFDWKQKKKLKKWKGLNKLLGF